MDNKEVRFRELINKLHANYIIISTANYIQNLYFKILNKDDVGVQNEKLCK